MQNTETKWCAVYTRKSTDERLDAEFNSLDAQYDACSAYVKSQVGMGWRLVEKKYDDGGYSGGTMNASSMEYCSTSTASSRRIEMIRRDISP